MHDLDNLIQELEAGTKEIEQARAKADALFLSIGDGAITTDENGRIEHVNHIALSLLGFSEKELLGSWYPKTILAFDEEGNEISAIERPIAKAFLTGMAASGKFFYQKKDGERLPVAVTVSPIILDGKPVGAIEVFRDNTKEFEIDRMKSEFISIASHQLRTPITAVKNSSELLAGGYVGQLTPEQQELIEAMLGSVNRMNELINTLLNITRIEAGRISIEPKATDLNKAIQTEIKELKSKADEKKIKVSFTKPKRPLKIATDPLLFKEVFANLLSNSIKYTPSGGAVRVALKSEGKQVVLSVADNGYGIPKAEQARIFTKFYRGGNIVSKEKVGTGLGLYMVKQLVDNLGGRIWFESKEGKSTTFFVELPKRGLDKKQGVTNLEPTRF